MCCQIAKSSLMQYTFRGKYESCWKCPIHPTGESCFPAACSNVGSRLWSTPLWLWELLLHRQLAMSLCGHHWTSQKWPLYLLSEWQEKLDVHDQSQLGPVAWEHQVMGRSAASASRTLYKQKQSKHGGWVLVQLLQVPCQSCQQKWQHSRRWNIVPLHLMVKP